MSGFPRMHCFGLLGDADSSRYLVRVLSIQEGEAVQVEVP